MLGRLEPRKDDPKNDPCPHCGSKWGTSEHIVFDKNGNERIKVVCFECERFLKWQALPVTLERAQRYVIEFGKHRGKTLSQIEIETPSYLDWLSLECANSTLKNLAKAIVHARLDQTRKDV
jgi:hypothetical protein